MCFTTDFTNIYRFARAVTRWNITTNGITENRPDHDAPTQPRSHVSIAAASPLYCYPFSSSCFSLHSLPLLLSVTRFSFRTRYSASATLFYRTTLPPSASLHHKRHCRRYRKRSGRFFFCHSVVTSRKVGFSVLQTRPSVSVHNVSHPAGR